MSGFSHYVRGGQSLLRCGYTTGTCGALAAAGATRLLLTGEAPDTVTLLTPKGLEVTAPLTEKTLTGDTACCAVVKDGGDDPDITSGMTVRAAVKLTSQAGITIDGGEGIGRVTKPGLDQPVGAAAINRVPRRMIREEVQRVCEELDYDGGLQVVLSIPGGEEAARKTFNPQLGIQGGLSILGTSGIVEPMSEGAIVATIETELRQAAAQGGKAVLLTPGNYGADYLARAGLAQGKIPVVKCSNFIGEALDIAALLGFETVLLAGHVGKLVKVAGGVMNTHSKYADCRRELFCAHAALMGGDRALCQALMDCATTDACLTLVNQAGLGQAVTQSLLAAIQIHLDQRVKGAYRVGALVFSNVHGLLGLTAEGKEILHIWTT